ncbi:MAG: gliding motility-associated C-terminal domain-containing protein, partial [Flavobacteriales bacterium]
VNGTNTPVGEICYQYGDGSITLGGSGGTGPYTYIITGPENDTSATATFNGLTAGNYVTYVVDANGCFATMNVTVPAAPQVIASFTPNNAIGVPPYTVNFTNTSQNGATYFWNFGDTTTSTLTDPTHTYFYENTYPVMLIVTSSNGVCVDTAYGTVITATSHLEFPNVFSPNGDGSNDVFHFNARNIQSLTCVIFNRWGQKMYESTDPTSGWNGKDSGGKEAADGTYYYILEAVGVDAIEYKHHGTVNLFRKK